MPAARKFQRPAIAARARRDRWAWVTWLAAVVIGVPAAYLVIGNLLLVHALDRLDRAPRLALACESASTRWPGRVHLVGLRITHAGRATTSVDVEALDGDLDLPALLAGELRVERARGAVTTITVDDLRVKGPMQLRLASVAIGTDGGAILGDGELALRGVRVTHRDTVVVREAEGHVELGDAGGLRVVVETPRVEVDGASADLEVRGGRLELDLTTADGAERGSFTADARWSAPDVQLRTRAGRARGAMTAALQLRRLGLDGGIAIGGGEGHVMFGAVHVERDGRRAAPIDVELAIERLVVAPGLGLALRGFVDGRGDDGAALLDVLGATPAVRLALDAVHGRPLSVQASIAWADGALSLHGIDVESGPFWARGTYVWTSTGERLALVGGYGRLTIGVSHDGTAWTTRLDPPDGWLTDHAARRPGDG